MRSGDQPFPTVPPHTGGGQLADRLRIVVEMLPYQRYVWDDSDALVVWDNPDLVWDDPETGSGFLDVTCDFQALTITAGNPDEHGLVDSAKLELSLSNPVGDYSTTDSTGRLVFYAPGRRVCVAAVDPSDGSLWWLFSGRVTRWDVNADDSVTVEAFDGFSQLSTEPGRPWSAGAAGDKAGVRLASIAATFDYLDPTSFATGDVALAVETVERSALEEMEVVALSDGGWLFVDQDGTLTYRDRTFVGGRPDQTVRTVFSDNICTAPAVVVWDLAASTNDDQLAAKVTLTNTATTPVTVTATANPPPLGVVRNYAHPERDLWTSTPDGQTLAGLLLQRHREPTLAASFTLHPLDPKQPTLFRRAIDLRLGDVVNVVRQSRAQGGGTTYHDLDLLAVTITHQIVPGDQHPWVVGVATSKAVASRVPAYWDYAPFTWDDPDPLNVWSI